MLRDRALSRAIPMLSASGSGAALADSATAGANAWTGHGRLHEVPIGHENGLENTLCTHRSQELR